MIFAIITLLSGLAISVVAAYYSIIGLTTIFSGSIMAVAIMGVALEIGKLVTASWLKQNWKHAGYLMRTYLTVAVIVLMLITSMGIFGYLSKAHLQQSAGIDYNRSKVEKIIFDISQQEKKIERSQANLERTQAIVDQLDEALKVYVAKEYVTRALKEREKQREEREQIKVEQKAYELEIAQATKKIDELNEEKFDFEQEVQKIEVEVGPLKYVADLLYGEEQAKEMLNQAVRTVILVLIFVFDPLAILLLLAANISFKVAFEERKKKKASDKSADKLDEPNGSVLMGEPKKILKKSETIKPTTAESMIEQALKEDAGPIEDWIPIVEAAHKISKKNNNPTTTTNKELLTKSLIEQEPVKEIKAPDIPEVFWEENGFTANTTKKKPEELSEEIETDTTELDQSNLLLSKPEDMKESVWQDKLLQQAENFAEQLKNKKGITMLTKEDMVKAVEKSFEQGIAKASIPFNLNSSAGEELKKIIVENLQKEYKLFDT